MRIVFATAELRPLVSVGGLGEAAAGLVAGLRSAGHEVDVILPDYYRWDLDDEIVEPVRAPKWAEPVTVRSGTHRDVGSITLVDVNGISRDNPYVGADGEGWPDNDRRFAGFSAVVAELIGQRRPDIVQLNDWHTGLVPAFMAQPRPPIVLTIHNLAHQGWANSGWINELPFQADLFERGDAINMLAGAIAAADAVVAVSPTYAEEIREEPQGMGLAGELENKGDRLQGILNGIDTTAWDPATDSALPENYDHRDRSGKKVCRAALWQQLGWDPSSKEPLIAMVTRLVDQKGVDVVFETAQYLEGMRARMMVLGSGDPGLASWGHRLASEMPGRFAFREGFDIDLAHLMFAGSDLFVMPSRFEPCGLAQMQAMRYGTIPVVTSVGGLADTVVDADAHRSGTGFVSATVDVAGMVDALHRALSAWRNPGRRRGIPGRGMAIDWSWEAPAQRYVDLYNQLIGH